MHDEASRRGYPATASKYAIMAAYAEDAIERREAEHTAAAILDGYVPRLPELPEPPAPATEPVVYRWNGRRYRRAADNTLQLIEPRRILRDGERLNTLAK